MDEQMTYAKAYEAYEDIWREDPQKIAGIALPPDPDQFWDFVERQGWNVID